MPSRRHLRPVVLAGGSGTRFWPLSREMSPKQMLTVFGGTSLVTQAILRVGRMTDAPTTVLTSESLARELGDHLAGRAELEGVSVQVVAEPSARNTAAAIALAAGHALAGDPDSVIVVLPSDHLLEGGHRWERVLAAAVQAAEKGWIVTLGLVPDAPETGYGYIRPGAPLDVAGIAAAYPTSGDAAGEDVPDLPRAHVAQRFLEKPDRATAELLLAEGCLWNSGMVVARADVVLAEMHAAGVAAATPAASHGVEIAETIRELSQLPPERWLEPEARARFEALPSVSFDHAVLEVSPKVAVVPTALEWSDVGSLLALDRLAEPDASDNVLVGRVYDIESHGVIAYSEDRLLATLGLEDVLVIDTADATLVASKNRAQDVRLVVDALKAAGHPEVTHSRTAVRPWGSWTLLIKGEGFQVKTIEVLPGKRLSLQSHSRRSEHWVVVEGEASIERDGETIVAVAGHSVDIPTGCTHRLQNTGGVPLRVIEVALGEYLGEDDIVRIEDDWERSAR